jgi:hypothetical protein
MHEISIKLKIMQLYMDPWIMPYTSVMYKVMFTHQQATKALRLRSKVLLFL